jgi:hypothetical protein
MEGVGALSAAQALVQEYSGKAESTLEAMGLSEPSRGEFKELIELLAARSA